MSVLNRHLWRIIHTAWVLCMSCMLCAIPTEDVCAAGDWQVKRRDRRPIMIRRLKFMLSRKPMAGYSFRRLMLLHRSARSRANLISHYQSQVRRFPKKLTHKIVLARIYAYIGQYTQALSLYQDVQKARPKWHAIALGQARCLLGLKRRKEAIAQFKRVLPQLTKLSKKRSIVQKILKTALEARDASSIQFAYDEIKKLKWRREQRISMARLMGRHGRSKDALSQYLLALKGARGGKRVLLLMEIIRLQIEVGRYKDAKARIKEARKVGTLHKWLAWELLMKEIDIYRRMGQLAALVAKLDRKWAKTRDYKKIILLARLYDELKVPSESERMYLRSLKRRPGAREPRLRLIKFYAKTKRPALVQKHVELLIKHKGASTRHYFLLIREQLNRSKRPAISRWNPSWPKLYKRTCRDLTKKPKKRSRWRSRYMRRLRRYRRRYRYRFGYFRRYYRNRTRFKHRCTKKRWNAYRRKKWRYWRKHQSTPTQRKAVTSAFRLMRLCSSRFSRDWDALFEIHNMLDRYGAPASDVRRTFERLLRSTGADLTRLTTTRQLLWRVGQERRFKSLLLRALRVRSLPPKPAVSLAAYAFSPKAKSMYLRRSPKRKQTQQQTERWKRSMCPSIRRFLGRVLQRAPADFVAREPDVALRMSAILWRCGARGRRLQGTLKALEQHAMVQPKTLQKLLRTYIQFQAKAPFERLIQRPQLIHQKRQLTTLLQQLLPAGSPPAHVTFVLDRFKGELKKNPRLLGRFIVLLCREKSLCQVTAPYIKLLVYEPKMPASVLLGVLMATHKHHILESERGRWLRYLIKWQYKKSIRSLQQLAETHELFRSSLVMRQLHQKLMVRVLQKRMTAPELTTLWGQMMTEHLRLLRPHNTGHRKQIDVIERASRRFPVLYRQVLAFYLSYYNYKRPMGEPQLRAWLNKHYKLPDLQLLAFTMRQLRTAQARFFWYKGQRNWIEAIPARMNEPEGLGWMMAFAHRYQLRNLYVKSLRKLQSIRPKERSLMKLLATVLEEKPTTQKEAARFWRMWFQGQPTLTTIDGIQRFVESCCADNASERMAYRLLQAGVERHGETPLWSLVFRVLGQVQRPLQSRLLGWMKERPSLTKTQLVGLASWSRKHKHYKPAIGMYTRLVKSFSADVASRSSLADLLEREGRFVEATPHWKVYIQKKRLGSASFFRKRMRQFKRSGQRVLAMVSMVRAASANKAKVSRAQIRRLQSKGKAWEAWAAWLQAQGARAKQCLRDLKTKMPSTAMSAQRLWQINVGYTGPLLFFPRCQWLLSQRAQFVVVPALAAYLKRNPTSVLTIVGSGDPNTEPDLDFLSRQRAEALARALRKAGISKGRLRLSHFQGVGLCGMQTYTPERCRIYRRQVTIATYDGAKAPPALGTIVVPLRRFQRIDADMDGVVDHLDHCPLQHDRYYQQRRYRRRPRRRRYRRYGRYRRRYRRYRRYRRRRFARRTLYRPWYWSPAKKRRTFATQSFKAKPPKGCPRYAQFQLKPLKGANLSTYRQIIFASSSSSYVHQNSQGSLAQIAALMRMAPQLGALKVHIHPRKRATGAARYGRGYRGSRWKFGPLVMRYRRYGRRYRNRRRYRANPMTLANRRISVIMSFLEGRGVPRTLLQRHVHTPISSRKARAKLLPYLRFVLVSRLPPQVKKTP